MTPEVNALAERRVKELSPVVNGFSHYIQLLIRIDSKKHIIGAKDLLASFNNPLHRLAVAHN